MDTNHEPYCLILAGGPTGLLLDSKAKDIILRGHLVRTVPVECDDRPEDACPNATPYIRQQPAQYNAACKKPHWRIRTKSPVFS